MNGMSYFTILIMLFALICSSNVNSGSIPLDSPDSEFILRYQELIDDLSVVNTSTIFQSRKCVSNPNTDDQSFCQDPTAYSNQNEILHDPTGTTIRDYAESLTQLQLNTVEAYQAPIASLMDRLFSSDESVDQDIKAAIEQAFPNNPKMKECAAKVVILGAFDFQSEGVDYFRPEGECSTSLDSLNLLSRNQDLRDLSDKIKDSVTESIDKSEFAQSIKNTVFPNVKRIFQSSIIDKIEDVQQRERAQSLLDRIEYVSSSCNDRYGLMASQAHYREQDNEVCFSILFLQRSTSLYQIVHTMAHEIGHAFDSCSNFCKSNSESYAFQDQVNTTANRLGLDPEQGSCRKGHKAVLRELMSDHFATEVTHQYFQDSSFSSEEHRRGFSSVFMNLQDPDLEMYQDSRSSHPLNKDRFELMFSHPGIRQQIRCEGGDYELFK